MKRQQQQAAPVAASLARLFSCGVVRELSGHYRFTQFCQLAATVADAIGGRALSVKDFYDHAFAKFCRLPQRYEYVYRAAILRRMLYDRHCIHTATMFSEFRALDSKADVVMLDSTATAYEIKSERDSLKRLPQQIEDYRRVFSAVNVITAPCHVDAVAALVPEDVGILVLTRECEIVTIRAAVDSPNRIQPKAVFHSIREKEAVAILQRMEIPLPDVHPAHRWRAFEGIFESLDPCDLHPVMVDVLRKNRGVAKLEGFLGQLPESIHAIAMKVRMTRAQRKQLVRVMSLPVEACLAGCRGCGGEG